LLQAPDVELSRSWADALTGYELHLMSEAKSPLLIRNRKSVVSILGKHATATGRGPEDITKAEVRAYLLRQYQDRKGAGPATLHQDMRAFWSWYAKEYGTPSPMVGIPRPKGKSALVPVLTLDQVGAILKACKSTTDLETIRNRAVILLLLDSGLRRAELCQLDISDIDLKAGLVVVRCGKNGKARESILRDDSKQALWRWLRTRQDGSGALFVSTRGNRLTPNGVSQLVARIGARAGVTLHPHMLRHAFAHYNLAAGAREHDLMRAAGWSSTKMLERYGAALADQRAIAALQNLPVRSVPRKH
jgi:integrase